MPEKHCHRCDRTLPLESFNLSKNRADGHHTYCRECNRIRDRARRAADPEAAKAKDRADYAANREKEHARQKRWRDANLEYARRKDREWRHKRNADGIERTCVTCNTSYVGAKCPTCKERYMRKWFGENAEKQRAYRTRYYQKRISDPSFAEVRYRKYRAYYEKLKEEVFAYYGNRCFCCGLEDARFLTIDHANNDGARYRHPGGKRVAGTTQLKLIKRMGYPDDIRLACWNCNCARQYNGGICPHMADDQNSKAS